MGNNFDTNYLSIGQIEEHPESGHVFLPLYLPQAMDVSIIVLDISGKMRFEQKYAFGEGLQEAKILLSDLPQGSYNAWIDLGGQTFIRTFQVEAPKQGGDWFDKFKGWFS